ncbi:hypothetical protein HMPREF9333_02158 [Johnsonella ignava ATCC 51276]|jgi:hypothetical protein|uniref:UVR domain-containing protein n=1 Tax=Johnsonella ignava ATCC 51276 TaxID=679200 RepID=G5GKR4_9FIRM|nr:UvrB/UvrC motif-containing protein [Johnsonella ignava]EHI54698.1 hypothetical protein HMPREF9333_02158 [Johnsonella ignava ATCC 51276]
MLCEKCKLREANIVFYEIIDGTKREYNLCSQCAEGIEFMHYSSVFNKEFSLSKLLSGLFGEQEPANKTEDYRQIVCPNCKTSYDSFINNSRFGCSECYEIFGPLISETIKQLQGSDIHKGKVPATVMLPKSRTADTPHGDEDTKDGSKNTKQEPLQDGESEKRRIEELELMLKMALGNEEYEAAAKYRDEIKVLKNAVKGKNNG